MKLIADSGSTKCDWMWVGGAERIPGCGVCRTRGINAALHTPAEIRQTLGEVVLPEGVWPEHIVFYGAGCGESFPSVSAVLRELLVLRFRTERVEVHSDLLGAARALLGRTAGIACILGTGSNSCFYDGARIVQNVPPLGYILGDEGSGAALGRCLLNGLLKGALGAELLGAFYREYGQSYEEVIRRVYREPQANRFLASLTPFIRRHLEIPGMRGLVTEAFAEFAGRNLKHYPADEVSFTGGIAAAFEPELRTAMAGCGYKVGRITASPAEGLIEYYERE